GTAEFPFTLCSASNWFSSQSLYRTIMPLFPSSDALKRSFGTPATGVSRSFWISSPLEEGKKKAESLSQKAVHEIEKAHDKVAKKPGIQLHSAKYYAACTFGGMLACVCSTNLKFLPQK